MTPEHRQTICTIVSIFETGCIPGPEAYSTATVLRDGAGISYGLHQCTAKARSLQAAVKEYYAAGGRLGQFELWAAQQAIEASVGMPPSRLSPAVQEMLELLRTAGADPRMQAAQEHVFDRDYWQPALRYGRVIGLVLPLSYLVLYDTTIHSGLGRLDTLRRGFPEVPPVRGGLERAWTKAFLRSRHDWLSNHGDETVSKTAYRTAALLELIEQDRWDLVLPLVVRDVTVS